jgi:CRP/FNR family transcriptional regulator, cyclic AMP receptor protein
MTPGVGTLYNSLAAVQAYLLPLPGTTRLILRRKAELFLKGQNADALYFIERGLIKLDRPADGDRCVTLDLCAAGDLLGEESLTPQQAYQTQAEALTPLAVFRIPSNQALEAAAANPLLAMFLLEATLRRKQAIERRLELVAAHDVERRILLCLADLSARGEREDNGASSLPLTQRDVANLIGATRETTSLMLNQMERNGLIALSRGKISIQSADILRDAAYPMAQPLAS